MIRIQQSPEVIKAMAGLTGGRDFELFISFMEAARDQAITDMLACTSQQIVFQHQGYALALSDVIESVRTSPAALARLG